MVSQEVTVRLRKRPEERRAEILDCSADIALHEGLEKITLRGVAERLGVRSGLISHYFPVAQALVAEAFGLAVSRERAALISHDGPPLQRMRQLVTNIEDERATNLARLWLNARHLARFSPLLAEAIIEQEDEDRAVLVELITDGVENGAFQTDDPEGAGLRILMAVGGLGMFSNGMRPGHRAVSGFVSRVAEQELGLEPGSLGTRISASEPIE